jgi:hypothetical protein
VDVEVDESRSKASAFGVRSLMPIWRLTLADRTDQTILHQQPTSIYDSICEN